MTKWSTAMEVGILLVVEDEGGRVAVAKPLGVMNERMDALSDVVVLAVFVGDRVVVNIGDRGVSVTIGSEKTGAVGVTRATEVTT
jgi:hypothetical protein